jgi:N-acetylglucosaminyldiphosphoundecaprenol N-acetyl-beta-D-mannosaminyltransferase
VKAPAYNLLGVTVHALTLEDMVVLPETAAERGEKWVVGNHNLHSVYLYHHDADMRRFHDRADYVHVDGMPLIWMGRLLSYPLERRHRHTSIDWLPPLLERCAQKRLRVFFLGSRPGVEEKAAAYFRERVPGLQLAAHHGYFDPGSPENEAVVRKINEFRPHALMVGMGMPLQERWISDNIHRLRVNAVWDLGAFMDYFAGATPTPPRWMGRLGLEWLHRLLADPRRMWRRYLLEPLFVLRLFVPELLEKRLLRRP